MHVTCLLVYVIVTLVFLWEREAIRASKYMYIFAIVHVVLSIAFLWSMLAITRKYCGPETPLDPEPYGYD